MLEFKGVSKLYLYGNKVISNLDMKIEDGEIISILGDEGSGKTTFIKVASSCTEHEGKVLLDGKEVGLKTDDTIVIFDDLAIFDNKTVYYNLAYPLKIRGYNKDEIDKKVKEAAENLGIYAILQDKAKSVSLLDKKRIGLARIYLRDVKVIYIDDITFGLDMNSQKILFDEFSSIVLKMANEGKIVVFSTSIKEEAIALSNRIIVMHYRDIKQIGTYEEIYNNPSNIWAAEAIDSEYNFEKCKLVDNGGIKLQFGEFELDASSLDGKYFTEYIGKDLYAGWHSNDFDLTLNRLEKVNKVIKDKDMYILYTNDKTIRLNEREDSVSTLPKIEKVTLFDFYSENSIMC